MNKVHSVLVFHLAVAKIHDINSLKVEKFTWVHDFRGFSLCLAGSMTLGLRLGRTS